METIQIKEEIKERSKKQIEEIRLTIKEIQKRVVKVEELLLIAREYNQVSVIAEIKDMIQALRKHLLYCRNAEDFLIGIIDEDIDRVIQNPIGKEMIEKMIRNNSCF